MRGKGERCAGEFAQATAVAGLHCVQIDTGDGQLLFHLLGFDASLQLLPDGDLSGAASAIAACLQ